MSDKRCATCIFWDRAFRLDANGLCTNPDGEYFNHVFTHDGHCPDWKERAVKKKGRKALEWED